MKLFRLNSTTDQLIERCRNYDRKAQHELYDRFASTMLAVCVRYVKSVEEAEEVLMNGFVKIFNKIDKFSGDGSFEGWMRQIMVNESLNHLRYRKNLFVESEEEDWPEPNHAPMESKETTAALLQLIEELPVGYRTVFNLFAIEGYGHKEIAEMLDIDENTSRSQLSRARKQLQERVTEAKYLYKP
ncbi:MAG: sigma-70 family RNA polymerase sigma factor [Flavobacteriia bacterium]|nr:sigma-70 family RNA polymerase sigma factor [Flavobacteriia bacterium]